MSMGQPGSPPHAFSPAFSSLWGERGRVGRRCLAGTEKVARHGQYMPRLPPFFQGNTTTAPFAAATTPRHHYTHHWDNACLLPPPGAPFHCQRRERSGRRMPP